jgi:hypothetical protein
VRQDLVKLSVDVREALRPALGQLPADLAAQLVQKSNNLRDVGTGRFLSDGTGVGGQ